MFRNQIPNQFDVADGASTIDKEVKLAVYQTVRPSRKLINEEGKDEIAAASLRSEL